MLFFKTLGSRGLWLKKPILEWEKDPEYEEMKNFVNSLKVVNDASERAIKLIQDFMPRVKDEESRQELIQTVEFQIAKLTDFKKGSFINFCN